MAKKFSKAMWNDFLKYAETEGLYDGEDSVVQFSDREKKLMNASQRHINSLGYEIQITTLTSISRRISEQKFFRVAPADFVPVVVGEAAWSSNIQTYRTFDAAGSFEDGIVNTAGNTSRLATADAAVDSVSILTYPWAKEITWSIMELEFAAKSGNWNVVTAKEKARKTNWDLGIQRVAFLGADGNNGIGGSCVGLLNLPNITVNTTVITKPINSMSPAELKTLIGSMLNAYRSNNQRTAMPSLLQVPESDYLGMANQASAEFPLKSTLQLLEEALKISTQNDGFKIRPLAYADAAYHTTTASIVGKQVYTLLNYDEESIKMDIPVDYTLTLPNSVNNFQMQNVGYGQFTGVQAIRPLETMYFQY